MTSRVFLSHNSSDKSIVESLAFSLLESGIHPWFDKWDLIPGRPWLPAIRDALLEARAVAVCLGPHSLGRVHDSELQVALEQAWRDPERLVIPVLLPGFEGEVPEFLRLRTWVDLRSGLGGDELKSLVRALEGQPAGPPERPVAGKRPYQALDPFREKDAQRFFGRRRAVDELIARLRARERLLTLLGASGSGKSSLMLAGLLPAVRSAEVDGSYDWTIIDMRPDRRPCHELARRLIQARRQEVPTSRDLEDLEDLEKRLRQSTSTLSNAADLLLEGDGARLLLAVDQLEEIFTQAKIEDREAAEGREADDDRKALEDREAFVDNLLYAAGLDGGRVTVVTTLRADFLAKALEHSPALAQAVKASQTMVLPMNEHELHEAIVRPAVQAGLELEQGLADTLVREVVGQPGDLPLLEFTLDSLWREREGRWLTWKAYRHLGGLRGAIAQRADAFLAEHEAERESVRRIFGRLVHFVVEGAPSARRRATNEELATATEGLAPRLVEKLIEQRLLSTREDGVEVAHEALIREWPQLRRWVKENREAWHLQAEAAEDARRWQESGRSRDRLWRGGRLARVRELEGCDQLRLAPVEQEFVAEGEKAERRQHEERLRAARRFGRLMAVASLLILAVAAVAAWLGWVAVRREREAKELLRLATANYLLAEDPTSAGLLLLEVRGPDATGNAQEALHETLDAPLTWTVLKGHTRGVRAVSFSPDGLRVVTASEDGTARIRTIESGEEKLGHLDKAREITLRHQGPVNAASFSPHGERLVTASDDGKARVWDARTGELVQTLSHTGPVNAASFSPGERLLTASDDQTAGVWDARTGERIHTLSHTGPVNAASFSPHGERLVTASGDGKARVWETETGQLIDTLDHEGSVNAASFSPHGKRVVTASDDGKARVWKTETGEVINIEHRNVVNTASFSPDGRWVVTASDDGTAQVWDAETGRLKRGYAAYKKSVQDASFSPDSRWAVTASEDGSARLLDIERGDYDTFMGHRDAVWTASFSPDGRWVATASEDGTARLWKTERREAIATFAGNCAVFSPRRERVVTFFKYSKTIRVWDVESGQQIATLEGHTDGVVAASFSADGKRIVTASRDRTARVWDAESGEQLTTLEGHTGHVLAASFNTDGKRVVTASMDRTARVRTLENEQVVPLEGHEASVHIAAFTRDGTRVVTAAGDRTARVWDSGSGEELALLKHGETIVGASSVSRDGKRIVTASEDGTARVWDAQSGEELARLEGHGKSIRDASFSDDGKRIVTASEDGTARVWDAQSGKELARLVGHGKSIRDASFSDDGTRIVTASDDATAGVWDAQSGEELARLVGHEKSVRTASFSGDGKRILTASDDRTVRVWRISPGMISGDYSRYLQSRIRGRTRRCLPAEFREERLFESGSEAGEKFKTCSGCVPLFFKLLDGAAQRHSDQKTWDAYQKAWNGYQDCLGRRPHDGRNP